ncbi:hypothetical protein ABZP36_031721 [Zizania latifolia]
MPLPPPPPLGTSPSRPGRLSDRLEGDAPHARSRSASPTPRSIWRRLSPASPPRRSPSPVPRKRPCLDYRVGGRSPQRGGSDRLEGDAPHPRSRSASPTPRSIWRRLSPASPPRRSPSPVPRKQPCLDYRVGGGRSPQRGGRFGFEHGRRGRGRGMHTSHRAPDSLDSGYGSSSNSEGNTQREGLMTYKQFTQVLEDDVSPGEAGSRYQEYRTAYIIAQKQAYFNLHKNEDWLKDMYHPTNLPTVIERRNEFCKAAAKTLILDLRNGTLDL